MAGAWNFLWSVSRPVQNPLTPVHRGQRKAANTPPPQVNSQVTERRGDEERKTVEQVLCILLSEEDGVRPPSLKLGALRFQDPRHQLWGLWETLLSRCYTLSKCEALTKQGIPGSNSSHHHRRPIRVFSFTRSYQTLWRMGMRMTHPKAQTPTFTLCTLSR